MTINATASPVLLLKGQELSSAIAQTMIATRDLLMKVRGSSLDQVLASSTKKWPELLFAKYLTTHLTLLDGKAFTEEYLAKLFDVYMAGSKPLTVDSARQVLLDPDDRLGFRRAGAPKLVTGLGVMLVLMHLQGVLILPAGFRWPSIGREELGLHLPDGPLRLVREASKRSGVNHPAFSMLPDKTMPRFNFVSRATKLILALNWKTQADIRIADLVELDLASIGSTEASGHVLLDARSLVALLERHYGANVDVSEEAWASHVRTRPSPNDSTGFGSDERIDPFTAPPRLGRPVHLQSIEQIPGCKANVHALSNVWVRLQAGFLKHQRRRREGELVNGLPRSLLTAISYLNLYLFYYLTAWFEDHPTTKLAFPTTPSELIAGIYVSDVIEHDFEVPLSLTSFLERCAEERGWETQGHYSYLKGIEGLFHFLAQRASSLPGCTGFTQPLVKSDYPHNRRPAGTNKRPIPRQVLSLFVSLLEAVLEYTYIVSRKTLSGEIDQELLREFEKADCTTIDTVRWAHVVGFIPTYYWRGKLYKLQFLPNCLGIGERFPLRDGRCIALPTPHGLHQVLVATFTGIRNEHIQWLDERLFDSKLRKAWREGIADLLVNTDKVKSKPWIAHVNTRVIEVLRAQREWRNLIAHDGFDKELFYQGNPNTKWPKIRPLFSLSRDGMPHPDSQYRDVWQRMLMCLQGAMGEVGLDVDAIGPLFELLPSSVPAGMDRVARLALCAELYGSTEQPRVALHCKGPITPHSARVGVVSYYARFLPASVIGTYITGQTEGVVYHYVVIDPTDILTAQLEQSTALHIRTFGRDCEEIVASRGSAPARLVRADHENSRLVKALATCDTEDVIEAFGCIAVSIADDGRDGLDVLRETRARGVAFNKTEICVFGNVCPLVH
jgi:hypothetical protein